MNMISQSLEVQIANEKIVRLFGSDIQVLRESFSKSSKGRSRICAHPNSSDSLHEMIIMLGRGSYIRPHRHLGKCESFHIIEGELDVVIFDSDGGIEDIVQMGSYGSKRCFFYRMADPFFHTVIVRTETVLFHETTPGPFVREQTEFAVWAPEEGNLDAASTFLSKLEIMAESLL